MENISTEKLTTKELIKNEVRNRDYADLFEPVYTVSHLISCDFNGDMEGEMLNFIPGTDRIADRYNPELGNGYVIVEADYYNLKDVVFYNASEHQAYYLDTYFQAKNNEGKDIICIKSTCPVKEECLLKDVTQTMNINRKNSR